MNTDWEKEFSNLFSLDGMLDNRFGINEAIDYVESLLTSQRAELVGRIEDIKQGNIENNMFSISERFAVDKMLDEILALLQDTNTNV